MSCLTEVNQTLERCLSSLKVSKRSASLSDYHMAFLRRQKTLNKRHETLKAKQLDELIPLSSHTLNNIDLFQILAVTSARPLQLQIIPTLVLTPRKQMFYYSKNGQVRKCSGPQAIPSFFKLRVPSSDSQALFVSKSTEGVRLHHSEAEARAAIGNSFRIVLQRFIRSKGSQFKVRVHWKQNLPPAGYFISARKTPSLSDKDNRSASRIDYSLLDTLQRVNSEGSVAKGGPQRCSSAIGQPLKASHTMVEFMQTNADWEVGSVESLVLSLRHPERLAVQRVANPLVLPCEMLKRLRCVVNQSTANGMKLAVDEMVIDFLIDTKQTWHILKIVQVHQALQANEQPRVRSLKGKTPIRMRSKTSNAMIERLAEKISLQERRQLHRKRIALSKNYNERFKAQFQKFVEEEYKLLENCPNKTTRIDFPSRNKTHEYYAHKEIQKDGCVPASFIQLNLSSPPIKAPISKQFKSSWVPGNCVTKIYEAVQSLKSLRTRMRAGRLKNDYFLERYGGERFVKEFVSGLLQKLFASSTLKPFVETLDQASALQMTRLYRRLFTRQLKKWTVSRLLQRFPDLTQANLTEHLSLVIATLKSLGVTEEDQDFIANELELFVNIKH